MRTVVLVTLVASLVGLLACSSGSDLPGLDCQDECVGQMSRECAAEGYRVCGDFDEDACLEWGPVIPCAAGESCESGQCVAGSGCQDECSAGARECVDEGSFRQCGDFDGDGCLEWGTAIACKPGSLCSGDDICPAECDDACGMEDRECTDATHYRVCAGDIDGDGCLDWGGEVACPEGESCEQGQCRAACEDECQQAGVQGCDGTGGTRVCGDFDEDDCLEWSPTTPCAEGTFCQQGVCAPPACVDTCVQAGLRECILTGYRECGDFNGDDCLEWSAPAACPEGQSCSGAGVCSDLCEDDCLREGDRQCDGTLGYRLCGHYDADECLDLSSIFPCGTAEICQAGQCVPACQDECAVGARECVGDTDYRVCGNFDADPCREWGTPTACGDFYACVPATGQCALSCSHDCDLGDRECTGAASYRVCGDFDVDPCRDWGLSQTCAGGQVCDAGTGQCSPPDCTNECEAGGRRCSPDATGTQVCGQYDLDPCLEWSPTTPCGAGATCEGVGNCVLACSDTCPVAGDRICAGASAYLVCGDSNGDGCLDWGASVPCGAGEECRAGQCSLPCTDECDSAGTTGCNEAGTATLVCGNYDADSCLEWGGETACGAGETCSDGICSAACTDDCSLEQQRCSGAGAYQTCGQFDADACLDWSQPVLCGAGESCVEGRCVVSCEDECAAGEALCLGESQLQSCGNWDDDPCLELGEPEDCPAESFCHAGACLPQEPPLRVLINEVLYDGVSTDQDEVFLELFVEGANTLDHFVVREINGANGALTGEIDLMGQRVPADGYFVIAHPQADAALAAVADMSSTKVDFQNDNESILLLWGARVVVDALGYGFTTDLTNFQGEALSAPRTVAGRSLSRDEFSVDSGVNRWDFHSVGTPSPGGPHESDWSKGFVTTPPADGAAIGIIWTDLVADWLGGLVAVFLQDQAWGVQYAYNDGSGSWAVETVYDEAAYTSGAEQFAEYYWAPPAADPDGYDALTWLGSLYNGETEEFLGVQIGYSYRTQDGWQHEFPVEVPITCDAESCNLERILWNTAGVRMGIVDEIDPLVGFITMDESYVGIHATVPDGERWVEETVTDEDVSFFPYFQFVSTPTAVHVFYVVDAGAEVYELRHRARVGGVWSAYDVVYAGLNSPAGLAATKDAADAPWLCFLDVLSTETDAGGAVIGGSSEVQCATGAPGDWSLQRPLAARAGLFPVDLDLSADANGPVLVVQDFYQQSLWILMRDGAGAWQAPALVDFGGGTGNWPAVATDAEGVHHVLGSALTPLRGILHSHD